MELSSSPEAIHLPALREDIALQKAAPGRDGTPHWNLYDPVRNRFFRIGWLEFELLSRWREGLEAEALCAAVRTETPLQADVEDALMLLQFLQDNELLRASHAGLRDRLAAMAAARRLSPIKWLLHHYLFIRIPLAKPDALLTRTLPYVRFLFRPQFFFWIGLLSLVGVIRVIAQWDQFTATFLYFFSWQGAIYYAMALVLAKCCHELGHAYTAKHHGLRVPTMGLAFVVLMPLLYTDTSEGWKLTSRRARLAIDAAGIIAELCLAGLAALLWSVLPEGPLKSAAYLLAAVTWISTLTVNLSPFMRFDGYYLLMDAVDVPNLQSRSFAFGRWQLRRWLLGLDTGIPEPEYETRRGWLTGFAFATWIYRFLIFTTIAATVYFLFFKLAGIILFAVEISWFILLPVWRELHAWWGMRRQWQGNAVFRRNLAIAGVLLLGLLVPWRADVSAEGYWQGNPYTSLYPPMPAQLEKTLVHTGQRVQRGETLFMLRSPAARSRLTAIDSRIAGLKAQLAGSVGSDKLFDESRVLAQRLAAAEAERAAEIKDIARLRITAPHSGVFRDMATGLYPGAWVSPQRELGLVVGRQGTLIQVYVDGADIEKIRVGAHARVVTRRPDAREIDAVVTRIDATAIAALPEAMLASSMGGAIAARKQPEGDFVPNASLYRVTLKAPGLMGNGQMTPVSARIDGVRHSLLGGLLRKIAGLVIRQSGF